MKPVRRKNPPTNPLRGLIIKVKPQAKKAKTEEVSSSSENRGSSDTAKTSNGDNNNKSHQSPVKGVLGGLVSYSDESEDEEEGCNS